MLATTVRYGAGLANFWPPSASTARRMLEMSLSFNTARYYKNQLKAE